MPHDPEAINRIPGPDQVNTAFADIQRYNKTHSGLGAGMVKLFKALSETEKPQADMPAASTADVVEAKLLNATTEGDVTGEIEDMVHADTFTRIGLKIAPRGSTLSVIKGERFTSKRLEPSIYNSELFNDFLGTLQPTDVEDGKMPVLAVAVAELRNTVRACFHPENQNAIPEGMREAVAQFGEDALRTFLVIEPEYTRLGLDADSLRTRHDSRPEGKGYEWVAEDAPQEIKDSKAAHDIYDQAFDAANTFEEMQDYVNAWGSSSLAESVANRRYRTLDPPETNFGMDARVQGSRDTTSSTPLHQIKNP